MKKQGEKLKLSLYNQGLKVKEHHRQSRINVHEHTLAQTSNYIHRLIADFINMLPKSFYRKPAATAVFVTRALTTLKIKTSCFA